METIIKTSNLTKKYGEKLAAHKIDINIYKGDIYGLIGRNGAGKTTILKMITGLIKQSSGDIIFNFKDKNRVNNIGLLIESPGLIEEFDAVTNIRLKMTSIGLKKKNYEDELLELVGLKGVKKKVKQFSMGMKQRLGLALALVGDPELLILDEPTNGMDPQGMKDFRKLIIKLSKEKNITFIISSHILDELAKFASRFGIIDEGNLMAEISSEDLEKIDAEKIIIKVSDIDKVSKILSSNFEIDNIEVKSDKEIVIYDKIPTYEINKFLVDNGIVVEEIYLSHQSLENYYLTLTGEKDYA